MGKYNFVIDRIDPNTTFGKILIQIPDGSTVLECGCATGYMTKFMKESMGCTVDVIEYDDGAIQQAKQYARDAVCNDIEKIFDGGIGGDDLDFCQHSREKYDVILFADILEHLRHPMTVLDGARHFLRKNGRIIVSIPNICHNDVIIRLFNDSFTYTDLGLLDNTHIHFWGIGDFLAECQSIGLEAEVINATQIPTGYTEQRVPSEYVDKTLLECLNKRKYGNVYQWVITLKAV